MPQVTITLSDTPDGGVAVHSDFKPAIGAPCSAAQAAALDIIARTRKSYGLDAKPTANAPTAAQAFAQGCETARQTREDRAEGRA